MRRSEATRYARWSAIVALLILVAVAGVYGYGAWKRARAIGKAPPAVPPSVQQRSASFAFSKVEGGRTLFTVRASRATEFKEGHKNLLEDVWITVYGRDSARFDNIHTRECEYQSDTGRITCKGDVQFDLESAEEARRQPGQRVIHVETSNVSFDRQTGEASSEQPVRIRFPYGEGVGVGVTYSTRQAAVRLHRGVELTLKQNLGGRGAGPARLSGSAMEYARETHLLRLLGPVRVLQAQRELTAGSLALELTVDLQARRLTASEKPELISRDPQGVLTLDADTITADFADDGSTERMIAEGTVHATRKRPGASVGEDDFASDRLELEFEPERNQPKLLTATGNVKLDSPAAPARGLRRLETSTLRLFFSPRGPSHTAELSHGETVAPATVEMKSAQETTRLHGERLLAEYGPRNQLQRLTGSQGVQFERQFPGRPPQVTTSQEGQLDFGPHGDWTEARQSGDVKFRQGERTARAERVRLVRASDTLTLTGGAVIGDTQSETAAPLIVLEQTSGVIRGDGGVRTTYRRAEPNGVTNLAPQPAHISAQRLAVRRDKGIAVYAGRARLWQGDAVVEGDTLELNRDERLLTARGNVSALLPQGGTPTTPLAGSSSSAPTKPAGNTPSGSGAPGGEKILWLTRAGRMVYRSAEGVAILEDNVRAESRLGRMESRVLTITLSSTNGGPQQLVRAVATDGVTVRQQDRRGTAERAVYTVAEGKFVLSGGNPTLYDVVQGTTTGPQLTFFLADDRILVDSSEGTRTLTRHRIQK